MKGRTILSVAVAAGAIGGAFSSQALAGLNPSNHTQWVEDYYYSGFGGPAPSGAVEYSAGFSTIADFDGRVLSNAAVTTNTVDGSPLDSISTELFTGTDANLYKFKITDPSTFSASITSTSLVLALFASDGTALAASIGGASDAINASNDGVTTAGTYYIGIANPGGYPENNEGQNIFGLTGATGDFAPAAGVTDLLLSTNPAIAWTTGGAYPGLLQNVSFFASGSTITLSDSGYAVVPEPSTLALLVGGAGLMLRRRRSRA
ncbi:MAG: PEP-CTERM sorting domain-containing protein [Tepidisphaeraceae bacterium]|jgi:hypothetical protein